jgi:hypothetical protein
MFRMDVLLFIVTAGRSLRVHPAIIASWHSDRIPADTVLTVFFALAVVLTLNDVSVLRYDLGGHSQ